VENLSWQTPLAASGIRGRLGPVLRHHCRARVQRSSMTPMALKLTVNRWLPTTSSS